MPTVEIEDAGAQLSRLVDEAAAGSEIVLARAGTPVARLVPLATSPARRKRVLGSLAGQFKVPDNFDAPLPDDILDLFEGR